MLHVEESIVIDRAPHDVWDYITAPANDTVWMKNVIEFEADWQEQPRVGDRTRRVAKIAGRRCEMTCQVTEVLPREMFAWKSVEAPFPFENGFRIEETEGGTRVTFYGKTPGMMGFFGKLADPIVARMFSRDMRSNLENLRSLLEATSSRAKAVHVRAEGEMTPIQRAD